MFDRPQYSSKDHGTDEEIVIAGIAGRFPESNNIDEFRQHLFEGIDLVNDEPRRWPAGLHGLPARMAKLKDLSHFDASFFGVSNKQADVMDPQLRLLIELTQEALVDAGVNPAEVRGTKTGVFIGSSYSETFDYWHLNPDKMGSYQLTGCSTAMFANRISYTFDFHGPSYCVDTACSSSLVALHEAFMAIRMGKCDAAIVGGANLLLKPAVALSIHRLNMLNKEGMCKTFDDSANGYARAEGVVAVYIQKADVARRIYGTILGINTNADGYKPEGITYPSRQSQLEVTKNVYEKNRINPLDVTYIEAHGTGTKIGDPQEVNTIVDFFCQNRNEPLLIGAVKSNMGHAEAASGVCSLAKIIIAMETGIIPANLHFENPNRNIPGLLDGRLKVVAKNEEWKGGLMAMSSYGFGGANVHLVVRPNSKQKLSRPLGILPRIIGISGRTEEAVNRLLDGIEKHKSDEEFHALIESVHSMNIEGHSVRGYTILKNEPIRLVSEVAQSKRPIWFVYSGMGSQWPGMAKNLMKIEVFRHSIRQSSKVLEPYGLNLEDIITNENDSIMNNIVNVLVSITAVQIALTDVLHTIGIESNGIVGHSAGETGCAYADGTLTAEQAILTAYFRGRSVSETNLPAGDMVAVGLSWEEAKKRCPSGVFVVCNNSIDSVTISGKQGSLDEFIAELKAENIFARKVKTCGYAFHSEYVAAAAPVFRKYLTEVIPHPKPRSQKWISSSVPESDWKTEGARYSSGDYQVNNFLSPVFFYEALKHIPENAILIEIAPHGVFQSTLLGTLGPDVTVLSLVKRGHEDNAEFLLSNLGKLYNAGAQPKFSSLYPAVSFPVGRGTPMISPLIEWDRSAQWTVANFSERSSRYGELVIEVDLSEEEYQFLAGHNIDGRIIFPGTGYITMVWRALAKLRNEDYEQMPVIFEDIHFYRATLMQKEGPVKFMINILEGCGEFEICEGGSVVVSGRIYVPDNVNGEELNLRELKTASNNEEMPLISSDIYKALKLRGYGYNGLFRGIIESDTHGNYGKVKWQNEWISFLDTVLQFTLLGTYSKELYLPTGVQKVIINPKKLIEETKNYSERVGIPICVYKDIGVIKSAGIEVRGLRSSLASRRQEIQSLPRLEKYQFIPYNNTAVLTTDTIRQKELALKVLLQTVLENTPGNSRLRVIEVGQKNSCHSSLSPMIKVLLEEEPNVQVDTVYITKVPLDDATTLEVNQIRHVISDLAQDALQETAHLIIVPEHLLYNDPQIMKNVVQMLKPRGFILTENKADTSYEKCSTCELEIISTQVTITRQYVLLKKLVELPKDYTVIQITNKNYSWLEPLKQAMKTSDVTCGTIYLYAQGELDNGLIGMVNCLRLEPGGKHLRSFFIQDSSALQFSTYLFLDQIKKDLLHNVLNNGVWGCYRHIKLKHSTEDSTHQVEHAYINTLHRGDLSSLRWIEGPPSHFKHEDPSIDLCYVYYAPLNFRDIMLATGKLPPDALPGDLAGQDCILGLEFSGRDSNGNRVMGMVPARGLATTIAADRRFLMEVPSEWSLEEASTVPVVYATSYYALIMRGRMQPGESILIHAGTGGVGQSAISIALHMGCEVFTTVSSQVKRDFLKARFPELQDDNIGYSRDTSFEQMILSRTHGRGVDLILNSLAQHQLQASVRCLAIGGRFLEIGKVDLSNNSPLGMSIFLKNTTFHGILLDSIFQWDASSISTLMHLMKEGLSNGAVKPLSRKVHNENQVEEAFRFMASGKHIGKVVVKIRDEESQKIQVLEPKFVTAIPRIYMNPDKSYVIVGGLGGFGLELANWMILRGANKIILNSRSGIKTGYQSLCVHRWQNLGVKVFISTDDATKREGAEKLLQKANNLGPVGGIFNLAVVLKDSMLERLSDTDFEIVCKPKVDVTKHLDEATRILTPQLDFFVTFSSLASGRGNFGQANYSFANSSMERICEARQKEGLPSISIQWGPVGDVGLVTELMGDRTEIGGCLTQRMSSCLAALDTLLQQPNPVVSSFVLADKHEAENSTNNLAADVAKIMGIKDVNTVPSTATLGERGMDSLSGTQIKQTLERDYNITMKMQDIRNLTFGQLIELSGRASVRKRTEVAQPEKSKYEGRFVKMKEIMPSKTFVKMASKSEKWKRPLYFVHPIEGDVSVMETLAKKIESPVYGLQCTVDTPADTIENMAKHYISQIKTVQSEGPYYLVGYSYGACVAFEMGVQLENNNEEAKTIFIDGSPSYILTFTTEKKTSNQAEDQCISMLRFISQFKPSINQEKVISELLEQKNFKEKIAKTVEILADTVQYPKDKLAEAIEYHYYKLAAADNYKPSKFKGKATLIKASDSFSQHERDYGLSDICSQQVAVYTIEGTHSSILEEPEVQKVVEIVDSTFFK